MGPDTIVPLAGIFMVLALVLGFPLVRAITKKIDQAPVRRGLDSASDERLERIEHAIDAMSLEIERISEGQRFLTKVLSDGSQPAAIGSAAGAPQQERPR